MEVAEEVAEEAVEVAEEAEAIKANTQDLSDG